jgi:hypothetical protein
MAKLIVYRGDDDYHIKQSNRPTYLYRIGSGKVVGSEAVDINDRKLLNDISLSIRDNYTEWVYSLNSIYQEIGIIKDGLSLFFLSDLSNKRHELFDTYETISNLLLIGRKLEGVKIDSIELIGTDKAFEQSIKSLFEGVTISSVVTKPLRVSLTRRVLADIKYLFSIWMVIFINWFQREEKTEEVVKSGKYFFSYFPQTFDHQFKDLRYGDYIDEADSHLVTVVADGMHQRVSPWEYARILKRIPKQRFELVDKYIQFSDVVTSLYWLFRCYGLLIRNRGNRFSFQGIDISSYINQEMVWSSSRIARLILISGAFRRVIEAIPIKELVYIMFEFSFGRMISFVLSRYNNRIMRTGFNHGDYSWRYLNYFLAKNEGSVTPPYINHCPIPDRLLVEDQLCADIYKFNGYQNIELMSEVFRLKYLKGIEPTLQEDLALIAAGLHDGEPLIKCLAKQIRTNSNTTYLFKPHPRADNRYIKNMPVIENLRVVESSIEHLLSLVGRIYVTYSGVGVEGWRLGIPVTLVDMPGKVAWSKLLDSENLAVRDCQYIEST